MNKWGSFQGHKDGSTYAGKSINAIYNINKTKDRNPMILSIDAEKAFVNIQHIEGNDLNIIKAIHSWTNPQLISSLKVKNKVFPLRSGTRHDVHSHHSYLT